ncbi:MAG: DNA repair protein RecO [Salinivirgaceae bacterium]|jgi:DNA repair protein RecO (recombination protein O)|nr:DNA repair protein RecO [Salinivirgaceae bacterium]
MSKSTVQGIVLKTIRYSDNDIIIHLFTREFGRIAIMVRRSKKAGRSNYYQPLFQLSVVVNFNEKRTIHRASQVSFLTPYVSIPFAIKKNTVTQFLAEILGKVISEHEPDDELYDFVSGALLLFDRTDTNTHVFHLVFLTQLTRFLGFFPGSDNRQQGWFSPSEGTFVPQIMHDTIPQELSSEFENLLRTPVSKYTTIKVASNLHHQLLDYIVQLYQVQLNALNLKSYDILKQVFA